MQEPFSSIEDFIFNASFRSWLLDNNGVQKEYWENWIAENPHKVPLMNYAKAIVYALTVNHNQLSESEIEHEITLITGRTNAANLVEENEKESAQKVKPANRGYAKMVIVAVILVICVVCIYLFKSRLSKPANNEVREAYTQLLSSFIEQSNNSDSIQLVTLFDGSKVHLYPKSQLRLSHGSFSEKREVHLTGEAFFEVKRNPAVPFLVYTTNLVSKVLGTSFYVNAYPSKKAASVRVTTGKVSVYMKENYSEKKAVANKVDGLVVSSNQQATYDVVKRQLSKVIVDDPLVLEAKRQETFVFDSVPLKNVLNVMQDSYGITIMCDESLASSCYLSASMKSKHFYEKLESICKAINGNYESIDGTILISSQGCK